MAIEHDEAAGITTFDSMEEMTAFMAQQEDSANASLHPRQIELRDSSEITVHWMRYYARMGIMIFGECLSLNAQLAIERGYYEPKTNDITVPIADAEGRSEFAYITDGLKERRARGYLTGKAYSVIEPDGEIGDTHVANAWPIRPEAFEQARELGWKVQDVLRSAPGSALAADVRLMVLSMQAAQGIVEDVEPMSSMGRLVEHVVNYHGLTEEQALDHIHVRVRSEGEKPTGGAGFLLAWHSEQHPADDAHPTHRHT